MTHWIRGIRIAQRAGTLLRAVGRAIAPVRVVRCGLTVVVIGVASLGLSTSAQRSAHAAAPQVATPSGGPSCPLSVGEQVKAVKAFGEMLPVLRHPRCLNCHGGVDPFSQKHPGADQLDPEIDRMTDREKFEEQCQMCHDGLKGWTTPAEAVFFVRKDDEQLCMQMKGFGATADGFVSHIHDDKGGIQFIATGYAGDRALGEQGLKDYRLVAVKPPGTQAELTAKARKWVAAMGGTYIGSPECGCVMPKIKLEIQHRSKYDPAHPSFRAGWVGFEGDVGFEVTLVPQEGFAGRYRGEASLVRSMNVQFAARGCTGTASQTEHWRFDAEVGQTSATMNLRFGFTTSAEAGSAECRGGGRPQINPRLFHDLDEIEMPLGRGVTKEETLIEANGAAQEWLVVKVLAVPLK